MLYGDIYAYIYIYIYIYIYMSYMYWFGLIYCMSFNTKSIFVRIKNSISNNSV